MQSPFYFQHYFFLEKKSSQFADVKQISLNTAQIIQIERNEYEQTVAKLRFEYTISIKAKFDEQLIALLKTSKSNERSALMNEIDRLVGTYSYIN